MVSEIFPDPETADENGIVCVGGKLSAPVLLAAYKKGIFPWPQEDDPLMLWFSPDPRGILPLTTFHVPKSLKKWAQKQSCQVRLNQGFAEIVAACASSVRQGEMGTWITEEIQSAYLELYQMGLAYSVGVYEEGLLIGGLYGVCVDRFVSAESMFYKKSNASKLALMKFGIFLREKGIEWVDIQMVTSVSESFGGEYIKRQDFLSMLQQEFVQLQMPTWWQESLVLK